MTQNHHPTALITGGSAARLKTAVENDHRGFIPLGETLLGIALLLAHQGQALQARQIYEMVWQHPRFEKPALYNGTAAQKIRTLTAIIPPTTQTQLPHKQPNRTSGKNPPSSSITSSPPAGKTKINNQRKTKNGSTFMDRGHPARLFPVSSQTPP